MQDGVEVKLQICIREMPFRTLGGTPTVLTVPILPTAPILPPTDYPLHVKET